MLERFTDSACRVLAQSQEEARRLDHIYVGTEHLLLGLTHSEDGVVAATLAEHAISLEATRGVVERVIGRGRQQPSGSIPFTPRANTVLELSVREARALDHACVAPEHLLLALIAEGEGIAAQVLVQLGADLSRLRLDLHRRLSNREGQ